METLSHAPVEAQSTQQVRAYDIGFDQAKGLRISQIENPEERLFAEEQFFSYLDAQMNTTLGERYNVSLSKFSYDIKDGQMWGKDMNEPFMNSLKRGRDYRKLYGKAIDHAREGAEVVGFEKVQKALTSKEAQVGDMMLSISPRGLANSEYQRNFYDIFSIKQNERGEMYVETRRYASALSISDYEKKLGVFGSAEDFLANPIVLPKGLTPDDLHAFLHEDYDFMQDDEFEVIKQECKGVMNAYARAIIEQPGNDTLHRILFNTIINKADDISEKIKNGNYNYQFSGLATLQQEVEAYGFQPVRDVETGCGTLGGYDVQIISPFGVVEYASDTYGERSFNCPSCKKENIRPVNQLLPRCLHCGSSDVAC